MDDEILREKEAAKFMRVSVGTLRNWYYTGRGPVRYKQGQKLTYYLKSDILAWLKGGVDEPVDRGYRNKTVS